MSDYKDIIVKATADGRYFGIDKGQLYWLCQGGLVTCDCACDVAGDELRAAKNVETITWAGELKIHIIIIKY